jgi:hypothetical protein
MNKNLGDIAILYVFVTYAWGALLLAAAVAIGTLVQRRAQSRRMAALLSMPAAQAQDLAEAEWEVDVAIETAQADLEALSFGPAAERRARAAEVREELARVDAAVGRLGALRAPTIATYTPAVARLHRLAARSGVRTLPRGE